MDPMKMRCQSLTKTKGKPHESVQFYSLQQDAAGKPVDSVVITSEGGSPLLGAFVAGREYSFSLEDLTPKEEAPTATETTEETTTITEADAIEDRKPTSDKPAS